MPSVVYGLWGIFFLAPKLLPAEKWVASTFSFVPFIGGGTVTIPNYFVAGLVLAIMILPIVSAISREVMTTVPIDHKEAALGLGATRWEMIRLAVLPYCRGGIIGGAMLGLGRAIGETIAVTILIGDAPVLGHHLFGQGYSLAAVIANEFGEAQGLHRSALFAAGLVLFVLTLLVNAVARLIVMRAARARAPRRADAEREHRRGNACNRGGRGMSEDRLARFAPSPARRRRDLLARSGILAATVLALIPLALIIYYLLSKGLGSWSPSFFTTDPTGNTFFKSSSIGGIQSAIIGTIEIVALASVIAVPIGVGVAIWLVEYGRNSAFAHTVRFFVDVLTGVPSILFGLFIYIALIIGTGSTYAGYKGAFALSLLMLPVVIRSAEVVLLLVPGALRESALALGAPRWQVIFRIVLPTALPGMVTGVLLAIARAAGETAPLLFTAGATNKTSTNLGQFMNSLPVQIYNDVTSPTTAVVDRAWGAALTLVAMILVLNLIARVVSRRSRLV